MVKLGPRRRAVIALAFALVAGGLAASQVESRIDEVESRVGAPVPVVVAARDVRAGTRLEADALDRLLAVEEVPERFAPPDAIAAPEEATGLRLATPLPSGSYVEVGDLETGPAPGAAPAAPDLAPGERVVEVPVAGGGLAGAPPGSRVDVLVTTRPEIGGGRTYVALQSVELLDARAALESAGDPAAPSTGATAALRVTVEQAVMLTAAENFAQEIRLLMRSPQDRRRIGPTSVRAADL